MVVRILWAIYLLTLVGLLSRPEHVNNVLVVMIITAIVMIWRGRRPNRSGWIYLIQDPHTGQYKIGLTRRRQVTERIYEQTKGPTPYTLVHTIRTDDVFRAETELHERFQDIRRRGEWFELSPAQKREICAIKKL